LGALRLTLDGLVSSVFLPQEVVRAVLSVEPSHRRAIFTQLVGLEDLGALEDCFRKASETLKNLADGIARYVQQIDTTIKAQVALQKERIKELSAKLPMLGLSDEAICPEGVHSLVSHCVQALMEFCTTYRLEPPKLPEVGVAEELPGFVNEVRTVLSRLEAGFPETERQNQLYKERHILQGLLAEQQKIRNAREQIHCARQAIAGQHGTEEDLKQAIEEFEQTLREINEQIDRAGKYLRMIQEALLYFETLPEGTAEVECPVCRTARVNVAHLRLHLASEMEKAGLEPLRQRRQEIEGTLREKRAAWNQLTQLAEQEKELDAKWNDLVNKVSQMYRQPLAPNESSSWCSRPWMMLPRPS
jgi:DNA repair exonuclease SbcCD ATPase subunit